MTRGRGSVEAVRQRATGRWYLVPAAILLACSEPVGRGWDWARMRKQPRYLPYASSAFFPDGKTMRTPPAGTVPNDSVDVGMAAVAPVVGESGTARSSPFLVLGATRFHVVCATCHGERGDGRSVVATNMTPPQPPSLLAPPVRALSPEQLRAIITDGFGRMPPFAALLSPTERRAVVAYVLALQRRPEAPVAGAPGGPDVTTDRADVR